jgi:pyruvate-formate lyase-activating enzyme
MSDREIIRIHRTKELLDGVSPSFCLAKWFQTTLYLQNGFNHSCHHPSPHKIPLSELENNPAALHNTQHKKEQQQLMLNGERPPECEYCWRIEDLPSNHFSDRHYKSSTTWALPRLGEAIELGTSDSVPGYLEVSFSNTCNFKCVYCSPEISSSWQKEISRWGAYPTSNHHNSIEGLRHNGKMPYDPNGYNPYVEAFWQWWPTLYPQLHTLRITGGEPLLSRDTWRVLDWVIENCRSDLTFCINTNLCVQDELIDKLIDKINTLTPLVKEVQIFSSGEAIGLQAEYTREGLDYNKWLHNMNRIARECPGVLLANMTTVNILSVPTFAQFLNQLLDLRAQYNVGAAFNRIQFHINYLRYPRFLEITNLDSATKKIFERDLHELLSTRGSHIGGLGCLNKTEEDQINRLISFMWEAQSPVLVDNNRRDFLLYVDEIDRRRDRNFVSTFEGLNTFYKLCQNT